jgi:hypothetical protein
VTEDEWLTTTESVAMQTHVRGLKVPVRRVQLLVVACGDLIWDVMRPEAQTAFKALRRTAEGTDTKKHKNRLEKCGPLEEWLDWILGIGGRTPELHAQAAALVREVFGNPFRLVALSPDWRTSTAVTLAKQMYESREFSAMPILADALQDAGCDNEFILAHCRDTNQVHVRGCWVVDLVLGKE